jgi:hypothetical protein
VHFSCVIFYTTLSSENTSKAAFYSRAYCYPFFHQNWQLFAPTPQVNYKLLATYNNKTEDVLFEIVSTHQQNRFKGYEPLLIALTNSVYYFEANASAKNSLMLKQCVKNYLAQKNNCTINNLKLNLVVQNINTGIINSNTIN